MTKKEFSLFVMALKTYYPRENFLPNEQAMELWYIQLKDISYQVAELVLNKWVSTNKWPPAISDIRELAMELKGIELPDWGRAWETVLKAIRRYGMYQENEALESMDEVTRQTVQRLGFTNICLSESIDHDRANFRMIYEQLANRQKKENQLSLELREKISNIKQINLIENEREIDEGKRLLTSGSET